MTLTVKFIIAVISLFGATLTFFAAVLNNSGGSPGDEPSYPGEQSACVYDGSYDACGGSR